MKTRRRLTNSPLQTLDECFLRLARVYCLWQEIMQCQTEALGARHSRGLTTIWAPQMVRMTNEDMRRRRRHLSEVKTFPEVAPSGWIEQEHENKKLYAKKRKCGFVTKFILRQSRDWKGVLQSGEKVVPRPMYVIRWSEQPAVFSGFNRSSLYDRCRSCRQQCTCELPGSKVTPTAMMHRQLSSRQACRQ